MRGWLDGDAGAVPPRRAPASGPPRPTIRVDLLPRRHRGRPRAAGGRRAPGRRDRRRPLPRRQPGASEAGARPRDQPPRSTATAALATSLGVLTQLTLRGTISGSLGQPFFLGRPAEPAAGRRARLIVLAGMGVPGRFGAGELTVMARELCWARGPARPPASGDGADRSRHRQPARRRCRRGLGSRHRAGARRPARGPGCSSGSRFVEFDPRQLLNADEALHEGRRPAGRATGCSARLRASHEGGEAGLAPRAGRTSGRAWPARWGDGLPGRASDERAPTRITHLARGQLVPLRRHHRQRRDPRARHPTRSRARGRGQRPARRRSRTPSAGATRGASSAPAVPGRPARGALGPPRSC